MRWLEMVCGAGGGVTIPLWLLVQDTAEWLFHASICCFPSSTRFLLISQNTVKKGDLDIWRSFEFLIGHQLLILIIQTTLVSLFFKKSRWFSSVYIPSELKMSRFLFTSIQALLLSLANSISWAGYEIARGAMDQISGLIFSSERLTMDTY